MAGRYAAPRSLLCATWTSHLSPATRANRVGQVSIGDTRQTGPDFIRRTRSFTAGSSKVSVPTNVGCPRCHLPLPLRRRTEPKLRRARGRQGASGLTVRKRKAVIRTGPLRGNVTRHREPKPLLTESRNDPHWCTPPNVPARDHVDGRSPGSRVTALHRLPGCPVAVGARLSAYSCGGSRGVGLVALTAFPFNPRGEPSAQRSHLRSRGSTAIRLAAG